MRKFGLLLSLTVLTTLAGLRSGSANPTLSRTVVLVVRVFRDTVGVGFDGCPGCNGTLDGGEVNWPPLPPMQIVVRDAATDEEIDRRPTRHLPAAGASYVWFLLRPREGYIVELADIPAGFQLCPNSPRVRRLDAADFTQHHTFISYALWRGCPLVVPSPTPTATSSPTATPTSTATATASPTPSPTPTVTPSPTATATATVTATPTATPTPTATTCPVSIAGLVWKDVNGNGLRDPGEPALAHAIVTLWTEDVALQSVVTGEDGQYDFSGLVPGQYRVVETDPPGYRSTTAGSAEIEAGCGVTVQDFGDQLTAECPRGVNGVVWNDVDGDGMLEMGEHPLPGATLTLRDSGGVVVGTPQVTGADGIYLFGVLVEDVYALMEDNPPNYPVSTTLDNWAIDLVGCREVPVTINFGDQAAPSR